jgi:ubiquinone/menaquinone biosynthesis C-methylase UbiE
MEKTVNRKPFQGVFNIVRFNWHFYVIALIFFAFILICQNISIGFWKFIWTILIFWIAYGVSISLVVSYFIYDFKKFYTLKWLELIQIEKPKNIININAGFDETSLIIEDKFPNSNLKILDFYDAHLTTEISIERARQVYPSHKKTKKIFIDNLPIKNAFSELIFLIFSAHEIRKPEKRIIFFKELNRILDENGKIILVEHLRDIPNFLAFNVGFFHFYSKKTWGNNLEKANLKIDSEHKLTIFTSLFIIKKNGSSS